MVKAFRLCSRRMCSGVETAERRQCHPVHIFVHGFQIVKFQRPDEIIISRHAPGKPPFDHLLKHDPDLPVRQCQFISLPPGLFIDPVIFNFQITACKKQAPDGVFHGIQLAEYDLFIDLCPKGFPFQQTLHDLFYIPAPFPDHLSHQVIAAGVGPVGGKLSGLEIIQDRPWVVYFPGTAEDKSVVPELYPLHTVFHSIFFQRCADFFLRKSKTVCIQIRRCRHHHQIVQIRKNGLLTHPCNSGHNCTVQIWIGLKRRVEQTSGKLHQFFPVSAYICLLHGRVVFVQQKDDFFPIISHQMLRQVLQ